MRMSEGSLPYSKAFAYLFKLNWAAGERVLRALLLNRHAPEVGKIERDLRYVEKGNRLQKLDVFLPPSKPPYPVLVYVHGGGNHVGDKRTYDRICRVFAASGCLVCNANYRMAPRCGYREQLQDAAAAVNWAHAHAPGYGGDAERMFLAGDSAGAYHAAMYAAEALHQDLRRALSVPSCVPASSIRGLLLFYGVYDLVTVGDTGFPRGQMLITGFLGRDPELFRKGAELAEAQMAPA
jgi:acetyl esterase/lipase